MLPFSSLIEFRTKKGIITTKSFDDEYVYDIEVDDTHTFFGNDILVHNSIYVEFVFVNLLTRDKSLVWEKQAGNLKED